MSTISVDTASVHLELNATVPDFEAQTTAEVIRISEWALNKWVILFSHPEISRQSVLQSLLSLLSDRLVLCHEKTA